MAKSNQSPWIVPVIVAAVAAGLFFAVVLTRSSVDQADLLGTWAVYAVLFVIFAVAALFAYRALRRRREPTATDEARTLNDHR